MNDAPEYRPQFTGEPRDELAIRMLCAWNNIPREQAPPEWSNHMNTSTRDSWMRVAKAFHEFKIQELHDMLKDEP